MRFFLLLIATNLKASLALRASFWLQATFMAINNLLFFVTWWILFDRFEEVRGYRVEDMAALYGITAAGFGVAAVLAGSLRDLSRKIVSGDLDPILTQPRSVLIQAISARTQPSGWGDVVSGIVLLVISGYLGPNTWAAAVLAIALAGIVFVSAGVMLHSVAFFGERAGSLAPQVYEFLVTFSVYPPTLFEGPLKVLLFTVLPAGLISYVPVELVRNFGLCSLVIAVAGAAIHLTASVALFHLGLRFYASGNRFGRRE